MLYDVIRCYTMLYDVIWCYMMLYGCGCGCGCSCMSHVWEPLFIGGVCRSRSQYRPWKSRAGQTQEQSVIWSIETLNHFFPWILKSHEDSNDKLSETINKASLCLDWFVCYFYIFGIVIALTTMVARPQAHGMACRLQKSQVARMSTTMTSMSIASLLRNGSWWLIMVNNG